MAVYIHLKDRQTQKKNSPRLSHHSFFLPSLPRLADRSCNTSHLRVYSDTYQEIYTCINTHICRERGLSICVSLETALPIYQSYLVSLSPESKQQRKNTNATQKKRLTQPRSVSCRAPSTERHPCRHLSTQLACNQVSTRCLYR